MSVREYSDLLADGHSFNERDDCTVRALAVIADVSYADAHAAMELMGREHGRPARRDLIFKAAKEFFGLNLIPLELNAREMGSVEKELKSTLRGFKVIVHVKGHVAAFDGEKIVDWAQGRKFQVQAVHVVA